MSRPMGIDALRPDDRLMALVSRAMSGRGDAQKADFLSQDRAASPVTARCRTESEPARLRNGEAHHRRRQRHKAHRIAAMAASTDVDLTRLTLVAAWRSRRAPGASRTLLANCELLCKKHVRGRGVVQPLKTRFGLFSSPKSSPKDESKAARQHEQGRRGHGLGASLPRRLGLWP